MSEKLNLNNLYNNIYCLAKNKKLKIGELEKKCGMNVGELSRLKLTNVSIRLDKAYNICQQFGCSLDDMCNKNFENTLVSNSRIVVPIVIFRIDILAITAKM